MRNTCESPSWLPRKLVMPCLSLSDGLLQIPFQIILSRVFLLRFEPRAGAVIQESFYKDKNVEHKGSQPP